MTSSTAYFSSALPSPAPLVNTRYELKGGLDTPTTEIERRYDALDLEDEDPTNDLRPNRLQPSSLGLKIQDEIPETPEVGTDGVIMQRKRKLVPDKNGWTRTIVTAMGGLAWKGIKSCWTTAFGGFHAGGGTGYQMSMTTPMIVEGHTWEGLDKREDVFDESYEKKYTRDRTPIPGQFPGDDRGYGCTPDSPGDLRSHQPLLDNKENNRPYHDGWTMVQESDCKPEQPALSGRQRPDNTTSLCRTASNASIAGARLKPPEQRRPSLVSQAGSPSVEQNRLASFASPRSLHKSSHPELSRSSRSASPTKARSSLSGVSPRRPLVGRPGPGSGTVTPTTPDVQDFERKVKLKAKKEEESIRRLNKQLRDMIREGKEALNTRVDVEDDATEGDHEDEGYVEGDAW